MTIKQSVNNTVAELEQQLKEANARFNDLKSKYHGLEEKVDTLSNEKKNLELAIERGEEALSVRDMDIRNLTHRLEKIMDDKNGEIVRLQERLENEIKSFDKAVKEWNRSNSEHNARYMKLLHEKDALVNAITVLGGAIELK